MKTVYGEKKYQDYLMIKNLLHYLYEECRHPSLSNSMPILPANNKTDDPNSESYFYSLENHRDLVAMLNRLIQNTPAEETIYIKISDPVLEIFNILFFNLVTFGARKIEIIFCMSDHELFNQDYSYEMFKNLCEMFLYNKGCTVYLTTKKTFSVESYKNCIFNQTHAIHFDQTLQKGTCTNYPEWIRDMMTDYLQLEKKSRLVGDEKTTVVDFNQYFSKNDKSIIYEFMPCVSLGFEYTHLDRFILPDLPNREEFIKMILENYSMEQMGFMKLDLTCSEKGMRTFMETGKLTIFPYPVYEPFTMDVRKMLIRKLIYFSRSDEYSLNIQFQKDMNLGNVPCLEFQINEYAENDQMSNVNLTIILEDLSTYNIFFYSPALIECCKNYIEIVHNPHYCYSSEETLEMMEKILEEY